MPPYRTENNAVSTGTMIPASETISEAGRILFGETSVVNQKLRAVVPQTRNRIEQLKLHTGRERGVSLE